MSDIELHNVSGRNYLISNEQAVTQAQRHLGRTDVDSDDVDHRATEAFLSMDDYGDSEFESRGDKGTISLAAPWVHGTWMAENTSYGSSATNPNPRVDTHSVTTPNEKNIPRWEDEELVTVPVAKLQQLVEYGILVLKESRRKTVIGETDLESNAARLPERSPAFPLYQAWSEFPRPKDRPRRLNKFLARARTNPWPVRKIEPRPDQVIDLGHTGEHFSRFDPLMFEIVWENHFRSFFGYGQPSVSATETVRKVWFWKRILKECDREMIPWLLEIGTDDPDARAATLIKILICIAQASNQNKYSTTSTIGDILERCYAGGVLKQSEDTPPNLENTIVHTKMRQDYAIHILLIAISLNIFNDCLTEDDSDLGPNSREVFGSPADLLRDACGGASLEQILAFQGPELVVSILSLSKTSKPQIALGLPHANSGRIDDLNIGSLRTIGNLRIVWTDIFEEHLLLDHQNKCLKIARLRPFIWGRLSIFQHDCIRWSSIYHEPQGLSVLKELKADIEKTWAILFSISTLGENSKNKSRIREKLKEEYETIIDEDQNPSKTYDIQTLKDYHMPWIEDDSVADKSDRVQSYYQSRWDNILDIIKSKQNKSTVAYSNFGMFENRVRELRQYMDNQKPHGLRQLLRDSRDALNYYTFMGVIIFGLLTLFLALASFLVGVAQTYAAFKALDMSS